MLHEPDTPRLETRRTRSADGTLIAYYATDPPRPDAPALVFAGGLAGHLRAWSAQMRYFGDRYRLMTWDYRGLFGSSHPISARPNAYGMGRQLEDLEAVLNAEDLHQVGLVGWSMGVQVALEAYRFMPSRLRCLVLINGVAGRPLDNMTRIPGLGRLVGRTGLTTLRRQALSAALRTPARRRRIAHALQRFGLIAPTVAPEVVERLVGDIADLSLTAYAHTLATIRAHDATDVLPTVTIPSLVIVGQHDPFTPPAMAQSMARQLPNSEVLVVPGGRHYLCLEYPDLVNLRLEQFLNDVGHN